MYLQPPWSQSFSYVATCCTPCCHSLSFVVIRSHSLSLSVLLVSLPLEIKPLKSIHYFYKNLLLRYSTGSIMPLKFLYNLAWNKYLVSEVVTAKIGVLKNVVEFTGKQLYWSPSFMKVAGCRPVNLLKKELWPDVFWFLVFLIFENTHFEWTPPMAKNKTIYVFLGWLFLWFFNVFIQLMTLTLSRQRSPSYRKQSIDLNSKSMDCFLNDRSLVHEGADRNLERSAY